MIPVGLCQCGCGQTTGLCKITNVRRGMVKGTPNAFVYGHNPRKHGRSRPAVGTGDNRKTEVHRVIAARALGKPLPPGAQVHHVDEDPFNNTPSNLVICQDLGYHRLLHVRTRIVMAGGNPNTDGYCSGCQQAKSLSCFPVSSRPLGRSSRCAECMRRDSRLSQAATREKKKALRRGTGSVSRGLQPVVGVPDGVEPSVAPGAGR